MNQDNFDKNVKEPMQHAADKVEYHADQASDKLNEKYYAGKHEFTDKPSDKLNEKYYAGKQVVREGAEDVKDAFRDATK